MGGSVSGLAGTGLTLRNNGTNDLAVAANGTFTFGAPLSAGEGYSVSVAAQPVNPSQTCTVTNSSGALASASVTNVTVACATNVYHLGGTVTGLLGSGLTLDVNAASPLAVGANGSFNFPTSLASGAAYAVTVATHPTSPSQTCTVTNSSGTLAGADVTNIAIVCTTNSYNIGGSVSGLAGTGLALSLNGAAPLAISADGGFTFPSDVQSGSAYAVTIATQPASPAPPCLVAGGAGVVGGENVTSVRVVCGNSIGTVGGIITGLRGTGLELRNNGGDALIVNASGAFTFDSEMPIGDTYSVTIASLPHMPRQICTVSRGAGTVSSIAVTSVSIDCELRPGNLRTSIAAPTYPPGSDEQQTFTSLNSARSGGGFGKLAQDTNLDAAARAHAQYLATRFYSAGRFDPGAIEAHTEEQGVSQFTGALPADRARAAGYGWLDGAEAAVFNVGKASRDCSDQILDSLVLRHKMMNTEMRDMGVGIADTADGNGFVCVVLAAYADFRGEAPGGWLGVYPFDTAAPITLAMASDTTAESFGTNRGMPVMLMADRDAPLSLTVTVRKNATSAVLSSTTVTNATLPDELRPNEVFAIPSVYLEPETVYTVRAEGTVEGIPVDQTTQFTTGTRSHSAPFATTLAAGSIRAVYAYPTDRTPSDEYRAAVQMAVEHIQGWYQQQLGGETFSIYDTSPQVCALPRASAYYLEDPWDRVQTDIQACVPAHFGDPDYDWVIYADVDDGCNLPGRLGAGWDSLTMLPRADLAGLTAHDTGIDGCGQPRPVYPISRWIGGLAHEVGHTFNIPHPPGCEAGLPGCDAAALMWQGYIAYPATYFSAIERTRLLAHRFINLQRFGR